MGYLLGIEEKERDQTRGEGDRSNIERDPVCGRHGLPLGVSWRGVEV
jgi:hypothetical protein